MKKYLIFATAALMCACAKNDSEPVVPQTEKLVPCTIQASTSSVDTKTALNGYKTNWISGDQLALYENGSTTKRQFTLASGEGSAFGIFSGSVSEGAATPYTIAYPYSAWTKTSDGYTVNVPTAQSLWTNANSMFDCGEAPMYATTSNVNSAQLSHLCGVVRLHLLNYTKAVTEIAVTGLGVAGAVELNSDMTLKSATNATTIRFAGDGATANTSTASYYVMVVGRTYPDLYFNVDGKQKHATNVTITPGKIKTINLDMSTATDVQMVYDQAALRYAIEHNVATVALGSDVDWTGSPEPTCNTAILGCDHKVDLNLNVNITAYSVGAFVNQLSKIIQDVHFTGSAYANVLPSGYGTNNQNRGIFGIVCYQALWAGGVKNCEIDVAVTMPMMPSKFGFAAGQASNAANFVNNTSASTVTLSDTYTYDGAEVTRPVEKRITVDVSAASYEHDNTALYTTYKDY